MRTRARGGFYLLCRSGGSGMRGHVSRPLLVHASSLHMAMGVVNSRLLRGHGGGRRLGRPGGGGGGGIPVLCGATAGAVDWSVWALAARGDRARPAPKAIATIFFSI